MLSRDPRFTVLMVSLLVILGGCVAIPPGSDAPATPAATIGQVTAIPANDCPTPGRGEQMQSNSTAGYCLLFPADYTFQETDGTDTVYYFDSLMDVSRPKLFVKVEDANGQTAAQIADALVAEVEAAGLKDQVKRASGLTLSGEAAEQLDNMPGQDLGRVVIAVHGPRAYRLTFVPDDPGQGDVYTQMEKLYDLVMKSFRFQP